MGEVVPLGGRNIRIRAGGIDYIVHPSLIRRVASGELKISDLKDRDALGAAIANIALVYLNEVL